MRKIIVVLITISLVLSFTCCRLNPGTNDDQTDIVDLDDNQETEEPSDEPKIDKNVNYTEDYMHLLRPRTSFDKFDDEDMKAWVKYIEEKYAFTIDAENAGVYLENKFIINADLFENYINHTGFVYLRTMEDLNVLRKMGAIYPVNDIIMDIDRYKTVNPGLLGHFTDELGYIWGFPLVETEDTNEQSRYYDTAWLDNRTGKVPNSIDEFYEFAMTVSAENKEADYDNNTYAADFTIENIFGYLEDIFRGYGCYSYGNSPVAYNPLKEEFENCVFNDNFEEAILFIKSLFDEHAILNIAELDSRYPKPEDNSYKVASSSYYTEDMDYFEGWAVGKFLVGLNSEKLVDVSYRDYCLVMMRGTENAAGKINSLFALLQSDPNSFMDFSYGVEGKQYTEYEDSFNIALYDKEGNYILKRVGILIEYDDLGFSSKPISYGEDGISESYETILGQIENAKAVAEEPAKSVLCVPDMAASDPRLDEIRKQISRPTRELINNIIYGRLPIETAFDNYRLSLNGLGLLDLVERMNDELKGLD